MRTNTRTVPEAEIVPTSVLAPIDLAHAFGRVAPLEVDLGCGDGTFLATIARQNPERNFLGIERLAGRVRSVSRKIGDHRLTNARVLHADILHAVQHSLPPASVDVFYLMFPDPWPKRRHHTRRTFNTSFLRAIARALVRGGVLHVATDDSHYFAGMQLVLSEAQMLKQAEAAAELPITTFEARFRERGLEIHRFALVKD
ncbi:MAG: tRNA (guanosine(46)-N7)-methyltransferase TrmB [Chthoniobacterales bacterium]